LKLEAAAMTKKARLGIYLEDDEMKRHVKIAAAKRGTTVTDYCAEAIEERLMRDGEIASERKAKGQTILQRMDELRKDIGPIGMRVSELIDEGRRR